MNCIKNITVKNIKGKDMFSLDFNDLHANKVNLIVAPNGYGKSTIVQAFNSLKPRKLSLNNDDYYKNDPSNLPELKVEFIGDNSGTYYADSSKNELNNDYDIKVINNAVVAKSSYNTAGAHLRIEPITIYDRIPEETSINYNSTNIKSLISCENRILINISSFFENVDNLIILSSIKDPLYKCFDQTRTKNYIDSFLSTIPTGGTAVSIKSSINNDTIETLVSNRNINMVFETLSNCNYFSEFDSVDIVLSMIQIIKWYEINTIRDRNFLKKLIEFEKFKINRKTINEALNSFDTTGRNIKAKKDGNKLIVKFVDANKMSNGERDVLVFLTELFRYSISIKKNKGILLIDEIFDYLDGSNLIVAQYFLSKFLEDQRKKGNLIYPLIFTHLDPDLFKNYYFKKMKTHYLVDATQNSQDSDIVKIIKNRNATDDNDFASKYLLHFHPDNISIPEDIKTIVSNTFPTTTTDFKEAAYYEVTNKYLENQSYNPILVLTGIRIKIEDYIYNKLTAEHKDGFIEEHGAKKKFEFASQYLDIPELLYILQPIYNDTLHLNGNANDLTKIKSSCLKLYNIPIKNIIKKIFEL